MLLKHSKNNKNLQCKKPEKRKKIALVTNRLRLAKESQTSELLKPTLLNKSICTKDIAEGKKEKKKETFKHFSDISRKRFIYWSKG